MNVCTEELSFFEPIFACIIAGTMDFLKWAVAKRAWVFLAFVLMFSGCGGGYSGGNTGGGGGGTTVTVPSAPSGLVATAGNQQVALTWTATTGATSYHVKRGTATGGPYTQVSAPTTNSFTDTSLTNGTAYFYVVTAVNSAGESGNSTEATATPALPAPPSAPTGLNATPGNAQVALTWTASTGATSYNVKRGTITGGPYTTVSSPTSASFTDTSLTNGTTYFYVVSAVNAGGESANSSQVSAIPVNPNVTAVAVTVDALTNRHAISPYIYGGSYPQNAAQVTDSNMTTVRWGGNATSTYNWQLFTYNADNDFFFEDFNANGFNDGSDGDSAQWITDVKTAGGTPLTTMVMLPWVAKSHETSTQQSNGPTNDHWSFSVTKYGAQCHADTFNNDAGNGVLAGANCDSSPSFITADPNDAYFPLLDQPGSSDPTGSVYRNQWAAALATAFGSGTPHFYDMDNEIDIWQGTHRDIHPNATTYQELRDIFLTESRALKGWDSQAVRLGPVSCCWFFYWRSAAGGNDTPSHGGVDFLPWWLNEINWSDKVAGSRSLDVFDIHAYPDGPDTTGFTSAQKQALAARVYRDWWDPTYTSEATYIINGGFSIEPVDSKPFRIPRMRAIANTMYPGTPLAITEWSAEFAGAADFSTALGDADAYGILGRERVYLASRWTAPNTANPNYQIFKLFRNYDGAKHTFESISIADTNTGDPNLFSSYAAINAAGTSMTVLVVNKDPQKTAQVAFNFNGFTPTSVAKYTVSSTTPTITPTASAGWSSSMSFAPYSVTLLVISGSMSQVPTAEWDLNPDTVMVPAGGSVTLSPQITSNSGTITLATTQADTGITINPTLTSVTTTQLGSITVSAPSGTAPGFYHFTVAGTDGGGTVVNQGGWIFVTKPAATLTKTGDNQSGAAGTILTLTATIAAGSSGGTNTGASIFFTTDSGSLSGRIVTTDSTGKASVVLTLPGSPGIVHVTAEGPYGLGHPVVTFTETAN